MSFLANLKDQVHISVRFLGQDLFQRQAVKDLDGDAWCASAEVLESRHRNDVDAYREDDALVTRCTCIHCRYARKPCRHVWATLLAADAAGLLDGDGSHEGLILEGDPSSHQLDYDPLDESESTGGTPRNRRATTATKTIGKHKKSAPARPAAPAWQKQLQVLQADLTAPGRVSYSKRRWVGRQLIFVVEGADAKGLCLAIPHRERKQNGDWGKPKFEGIDQNAVDEFPDPDDRKVLALLVGAERQGTYAHYNSYTSTCRFSLAPDLAATLVPLLCRTGRCFLRTRGDADLQPLTWDEGQPWSFLIKMTRSADGKTYRVAGLLRRGDATAELAQTRALTANLVVWEDRVSPLALEGSFHWVRYFQRQPFLEFPARQKEAWLEQFLRLPSLPRLEFPEDMKIEEVEVTPQPRLRIQPPRDKWRQGDVVEGELSFGYGGHIVAASVPGPIYRADVKQLIRRSVQVECQAAEHLQDLGFALRQYHYTGLPPLELKVRHLSRVVAQLLADGWHVEAEGKLYRQPGKLDIEVTTGIDWFELHGQVDFEGTTIGLPALLTALKNGENTVVLGDGSLGMMPEDWLKKYGFLAGLGKAEEDHLRFGRNQAGLLDVLLAAQPEARCDAAFSKVRAELRAFDGIQPADPPAGFQGELRGYQRDGLGWLHFLRRFGFGGCLADDMGLGKTVQVLALLDGRRHAVPKPGPSLVVVPKSLVFNWLQEAAHFTPGLRVLDHTPVSRRKPGDHFDDYDLVLTTYGILRRDALELKERRFDYAILDEAQAVKNAKSESAKAVRLLQADHRLAVTGTPVENHLGELWSLFEFLNPGMLGQASVFQLAGAGARNPEPETRDLLARALRPFLLRRTKEQVAKDLPAKTEQTLYAEMEPPQRKLYDELRDHYRQALLARVATEGMAKSKIQILEALLRLRQAACHPGLIDKQRTGEPSAKLDVLLPQLAEVLDEGHKALVFSQFTSLLAIVRQRLDQDNIAYEYLDGRTRKRGDKVQRFQNDPACKLFLISLKAGGLGLNLTAAEYVFLLDPWWNPAVEAQAIDRTHRIGQTAPVFAYRLIVKDTVEEKVLQLQDKKRALADAILNADNSLLRTLGREDLELLLS